MKLVLTDVSWVLDELNPIEWRFLSQLPDLAAGTELPEDCLRRLKPNPFGDSGETGGDHSGFENDWREYVEPDLDQLFNESRHRVAGDLAGAEAHSKLPLPERIEILNGHSEDWYSVINQARLLLNEAYGLAEATERFDFEAFGESQEGVERILLFAQYEFYTAIQSILLEHRMEP